MDSDFGNTMASLPQSRNRLEGRRDKDDEMPSEVWKTVEANTRKIRMAETEEGSRKEMRRKREKEETKEGEDDGSKESSRRMGNMG